MRPSISLCWGKSTSEIMETYFPDVTQYDYALPQPWVDECMDKDFDPRGKCVWSYEHKTLCGEPLWFTLDWENEFRRVFKES